MRLGPAQFSGDKNRLKDEKGFGLVNRTVSPTDRFLARRLQVLREAQGINLETWASAMELPADAAARLESGDVRLDAVIVAKAAAALGVGVFTLFDVEPSAGHRGDNDLDEIRLTCTGELMQVGDLLTLRLVLTLLWIMREEGVAGLSSLGDPARWPHRQEH